MDTNQEMPFRRGRTWGLAAACASAVVLLAVGWGDPARLWRAYLIAVMFPWPIAMGGLGLLALGNLTGGRWAAAARPYYVAAAKTLPVVVFVLLPLGLGLEHIYPWARESTAAELGLSPAKAKYLSTNFFLARSAGYMLVWLLVGWWVSAVSRPSDSPASTPAMRRAGALSLVLLVPTATFAAYDWMMSLEPLWYSSIYGAIVTAAGVVGAHGLAMLGLARTPESLRRPLLLSQYDGQQEEAVYEADRVNDLGNLMLAFLMVCAYFAFSQFFIIWSANLPSEIIWYVRRSYGGWQWLMVAFVLLGFVFPFLMLLSRDAKRALHRLVIVAWMALIGYCLHKYWSLAPALVLRSSDHVAMLAATVGIGGLWIALYGWFCEREVKRFSDVSHRTRS